MTISGHDPSGGAGLAADIETILACGARAAPLVSSMTIQDTHRVYGATPVDADYVQQQAEKILTDLPVAVIKLGLLGSIELVEMLAELLTQHATLPVVLDPVLSSGGGQAFAGEDYTAALSDRLLGKCTLITPNQQEALRLARQDSLDSAIATLLATGVNAMLLTGADVASQDVINTLYLKDEEPIDYFWPRLPGQYHGSGCTLAAACAAFMALDKEIPAAVAAAQEFTWQALKAGVQYSDAQYLPDRGFGFAGDTQ